ncbi:MAG: ribosome biogenesis factor YjgA [Motiliproteus sp.]
MTNFFKDKPEQDPEIKSRTQMKREVEALQELGKKLIDQKADVIDKLPLGDALMAALKEAKRIHQNEAKRRHLQYIGKLMRDVDIEEIFALIERQEAGTKAYVQHFHLLESWRDRLLKEDSEITAFLEAYPNGDRQHLRQMIRNAKREEKNNKPPASARKLFKYISELDKENS